MMIATYIQAAHVPLRDRRYRLTSRRTRQILSVLLCITVAFGALTATFAQTTLGKISGNVTDPTGAAVPNCAISIENIGTGITRTSSTDTSGSYNVPALQPGQYELTVAKTGFDSLSRSVTVAPGQAVSLDLQLTLGTVSQQVQVTGTGQTVLVEKDSHEMSQVIDSLDLKDVPVSVTNYLSLASLITPGAQASYDEQEGSTATFFGTSSNTILLSGQPLLYTTFLQDGVENMSLIAQSANLVLGPAAIESVSIESIGSNARFDRPSVVNVMTKSGTNSFHGQAYDLFRNDALNATNYFAKTKPQQRFNNFGVNLGGPILKNRLFAFFDYNGQRNSSQSTYRARVPTAAERQGDLSAEGIPIYEPGTTTQFPGNVIPASQISSFATKYLALFPNPTGPLVNGINYQKNLGSIGNIDQFLGRVDYHMSPSDTLWGTIQTGNSPVISENPVSVFNPVSLNTGWNAYLQEVHSFTPSIVNIARFGYNRSVLYASIKGAGTQNWTEHFGLVNLSPSPIQQAPPQVSISNIGTQGNPFAPDGSTQNRFEYANEVDWTHGKHNVFLGAELDRIQFDGSWVVYNNGAYYYTGQYTGSGYGDFLLNYPNYAFGGIGKTVGKFREWDASGYFQDDWKVSHNLTLNLGLRYAYYQPVTDKIPNQQSIYHLADNVNVPGSWASNYLNFSPRVGFAYAVGENTSVRGGYGIYYAPFVYNYVDWTIGKPPNYSLQFQYEGPTSLVTTEKYFGGPPTGSALAPFTLNPHMPTPYIEQWNLNIQHTFSSDYLFSIAYIGARGHHESERFNPNQAVQEDTAHPLPLQSRRPYPYVSDVNAVYNIGYSNSNALQAYLRKRFTKGLSFQLNYTWSHTLNIQDSGYVYAGNGLDPDADYGTAGFDRKHVFTATAIYELPFGTGKPIGNHLGWFSRQVIGGWQASGIFTAETGLPFSVVAADTANVGGTREPYATRLCKGTQPIGKKTINNWFNTSCFAQPAAGVIGNSGRNILRNPGFNTFHLSGFKTFSLDGSRSLQFRADAFSAFNHPTFNGAYYQDVNASTFGKLTGAGGNRTIQLAMRLVF